MNRRCTGWNKKAPSVLVADDAHYKCSGDIFGLVDSINPLQLHLQWSRQYWACISSSRMQQPNAACTSGRCLTRSPCGTGTDGTYLVYHVAQLLMYMDNELPSTVMPPLHYPLHRWCFSSTLTSAITSVHAHKWHIVLCDWLYYYKLTIVFVKLILTTLLL